jgi:hypothetical protein
MIYATDLARRSLFEALSWFDTAKPEAVVSLSYTGSSGGSINIQLDMADFSRLVTGPVEKRMVSGSTHYTFRPSKTLAITAVRMADIYDESPERLQADEARSEMQSYLSSLERPRA